MARLLPREHSVTSIMVFSVLGVPLLARDAALLPVALALLALHLATFDALLDSLRARRVGRAALITVINAAPYAVLAVVWRCECLLLLLAALAAGAPMLLAYAAPRSAATYVAGALAPVAPGYALAAVSGYACPRVTTYLAMLSVYVVATALYVESLLPFRRVPHVAALALWAPAAGYAVASNPLLAIPVVEPSVKLVYAAVRRVKVEPRRLKRLGVLEAARLTLYSLLLGAVCALTLPC